MVLEQQCVSASMRMPVKVFFLCVLFLSVTFLRETFSCVKLQFQGASSTGNANNDTKSGVCLCVANLGGCLALPLFPSSSSSFGSSFLSIFLWTFFSRGSVSLFHSFSLARATFPLHLPSLPSPSLSLSSLSPQTSTCFFWAVDGTFTHETKLGWFF